VVVIELADRAIYRTVGIIWRGTSARSEQYRELASLLRRLVGRDIEDCPVLGAG
jgi:hypothetical protein